MSEELPDAGSGTAEEEHIIGTREVGTQEVDARRRDGAGMTTDEYIFGYQAFSTIQGRPAGGARTAIVVNADAESRAAVLAQFAAGLRAQAGRPASDVLKALVRTGKPVEPQAGGESREQEPTTPR